MSAAELRAQPAVLAGYPGDKPFAQVWGMAHQIEKVNEKTITYKIDTYGGQSGSPGALVFNRSTPTSHMRSPSAKSRSSPTVARARRH